MSATTIQESSPMDPTIDPILFIVNTKNTHVASKTALEKHIKDTVKGRVLRSTMEISDRQKTSNDAQKIKVVVYPGDRSTYDEILSNECDLLKGEVKRSLAINQYEIIITNVSLETINSSRDVNSRLKELGLIRFGLISNKHSSEKNLVRAVCANEATQKSLLKNDIEMPIGDRIKTFYVEPAIKAVIQCHKCKEFGHIAKNCAPSYPERCGECNNVIHEGEMCGELAKCRNCNEFHSSYNRKCTKYRAEKDKQIAIEMIKHGIKAKRGKKFEVSSESSRSPKDPRQEYAKICSYGSELDALKSTIVEYKNDRDKVVSENNTLLSEVKNLLAINKNTLDTLEEKNNNKLQAAYEIITDETNFKLNTLAESTNCRLNNIEKALCQMAEQRFEEKIHVKFERKLEFTQIGNGGGQSQTLFISKVNEKANSNN